MKHFILFFITISFSFNTVGQNQRNLFNGSWVFNYETSLNQMNLEAKSHYRKMSERKKIKVENNYKGRVIVFNENGKYVQKLQNGFVFSASWELGNQNNLLITSEDGQIREYMIILISNTELIIKPKPKLNIKPLISQWHFTKNN